MSREGVQQRMGMWRPAPRVVLQVGISWLGSVSGLVIVGIWPEVANSWLFLFIVACLFLLWVQIERYDSHGWPHTRHLVVPLVLLGVAAWRIFMHIGQSVV